MRWFGCFSLQSHVVSLSSHSDAGDTMVQVLTAMAIPVELSDRESLIKSASTSLNSKV